MGSDRWTLDDGRRWAALAAPEGLGWLLVVLWLAVRVVVAVHDPFPDPLVPCSFDDCIYVSVPTPGIGLWVVACLGSVVLIRLWPEAALLCAVCFAVADGWWLVSQGAHQPLRVAAVGGYAVACAADTWRLRRAVARQRTFALERAKPDVHVPPGPTVARGREWDSIRFDRALIVGVALVSGAVAGVVAWDGMALWTSLYEDETSLYGPVSPVTWITAGAAGAIVIGGALWRRHRRRVMAIRGLSSGVHPGLPVELTAGAYSYVWVCARGHDEPFISADWVPGAVERAIPVGTTLEGYLYGDLHTGGWAALATAGTVVLPTSVLKPHVVKQANPVTVRDAPAPHAVIGAQQDGSKSTRYEVHPHEIVRLRSDRRQQHPTREAIGFDEITAAYLIYDADSHPVKSLTVQAPGREFNRIPDGPGQAVVLAIGQRLVAHGRAHTIENDDTRIHLGLLGGRRAAPRQQPATPKGPIDHLPTPNLPRNAPEDRPQDRPQDQPQDRPAPVLAAGATPEATDPAEAAVQAGGTDGQVEQPSVDAPDPAALPRPPSRRTETVIVRQPLPATLMGAGCAAVGGGVGSWLVMEFWTPVVSTDMAWAVASALGVLAAVVVLVRLPRCCLILEPERLVARTMFGQRVVDRVDIRGVDVQRLDIAVRQLRIRRDNQPPLTLPEHLTYCAKNSLAAVLRTWLAGEPSAKDQSADNTDKTDGAAKTTGGARAQRRAVGSILVLLAGAALLAWGAVGLISATAALRSAESYTGTIADIVYTDDEPACIVTLDQPPPDLPAARVRCSIEEDIGERVTIWVDPDHDIYHSRVALLAPRMEPLLIPLWTGAFLLVLGLRLHPRPRRRERWISALVPVAMVLVITLMITLVAEFGSDRLLGNDQTAAHGPPAVNLPSQSPSSTPTLSSTTPEPSPAGSTSPAAGRRVYRENLQPGMCGSLDYSDLEHFNVVACSAEHEAEVMSRSTLAGTKEYPGDDAVADAALAKCTPAFAAYVGLQWEDSLLDLDYLTPFEDTWKAGKNTLICLVLDPGNDQLTGSLRGAHR